MGNNKASEVDIAKTRRKIKAFKISFFVFLILGAIFTVINWIEHSRVQVYFEAQNILRVQILIFSFIVQSLFILISVGCIMYSSKLDIDLRRYLFSKRSTTYKSVIKSNLVIFTVLEIVLVLLFIASFMFSRYMGSRFADSELQHQYYALWETIFLIYTIFSILAVALDFAYVNHLINIHTRDREFSPDGMSE